MNRSMLRTWIGRWVIAAAASTGAAGCIPFAGGCGNPRDEIVDGGPTPGEIKSDGGSIDCTAACRRLAGLTTVDSCKQLQNDAGQPVLECIGSSPCEGRRPAALVSTGDPVGDDLVGRHFARMAHLEEASIAAFEQLRAELIAHGAPAHLVDGAARSARDEIRHARVTTALARRFGAEPARAVIADAPPRSLEALAVENAVEGCVRETYGAVVATWQAQAAEDARVRRVMARIADDETRHAELAWSIARWAEPRLDEASRARVAEARARAAAELEAALTVEPTAPLRAVGLPPAEVARTLFQSMRRDLAI